MDGKWRVLPALIAPAAVCTPAFAVQYLTLEQAQKAIFPEAEGFTRADVAIGPELKRRVEQETGVRVRNASQAAWKAGAGGNSLGWLFVDEVVGKHEFITYAVGVSAEGVVRSIEIMDYRETHGGQVRGMAWRQQFAGKKHGAQLKLDADIRNISGATLSCRNVTDGVKRLLALHNAALR